MKNIYDISDFVPILTEQKVKRDLATRFKQRRKEFGISQKELSQKSGVSYASIRRFESIGEISLSGLISISFVIGRLNELHELFHQPIVKDIRE